MNVTKHDGSSEPLDINKLTNSLEWAGDGLQVSMSDVEMSMNLHFYDGITTSDILDTTIKTCRDLSSLKSPDYDTMGARLVMQKLYKAAYQSTTPVSLMDYLDQMISDGFYSDAVTDSFTELEIDVLSRYLDNGRDFTFTLSGIEKFIDSYFIRGCNETPQMLFMAVAMDTFRDYHTDRLDYIKLLYDKLSRFEISLPSPEMTALRTDSTDYASCIIIRFGDMIRSWTEGKSALIKHTVASAGIGVDIADVASAGDLVKDGKIVHSGKVKLMRSLDADIQTSSQMNRRGQAVTYVNLFDPEIRHVLSLKSPRTAIEQRIQDLKHGIKISGYLYHRMAHDMPIYLFSSRQFPDVHNSFGTKDSQEFQIAYEAAIDTALADNPLHPYISGSELMELFASERFENGIYYIMNVDHSNTNSSWKKIVRQANICVEFLSPIEPIDEQFPDRPDIGVCVLSNINQATISIEQLPEACDLLVRMQSHIMLRQEHPTSQANAYVKTYRDIGIGFGSHAHWLAKNGWKYGEQDALEAHYHWMEAFQYHLMLSSTYLAEELGRAPGFADTTYSDLVMPHDRCSQSAMAELFPDGIELRQDWDYLRTRIGRFGMFNCGFSMVPPGETSSIIGNMTSGLEPIRDLMTIKSGKSISIKQIAPGYPEFSQSYDTAFDREITQDYLRHVAVTQMWIDKSISANTYYNPELYPNGKVPIKTLIRDIYFGYKLGMKTFYYNNVKSPDEFTIEQHACAGGGCEL